MREDVVPSTTALRDALKRCSALIEAVSATVRNPNEPPRVQNESAIAAARLGGTAAQLMSALARAADADTRMRLATMRLEDAEARRYARRPRRRKPAAEHPTHDDGLYNPEDDYDNFEEQNLDFNSAARKPAGQNLDFNSKPPAEKEKPLPRIRQL